VLLTSRVSVEMLQKAAVAGAPIVAALSAATALALETANRAGLTLIAVARGDGFEVFTHPNRIEGVVAQTRACTGGRQPCGPQQDKRRSLPLPLCHFIVSCRNKGARNRASRRHKR
jgi:hypothetical protein